MTERLIDVWLVDRRAEYSQNHGVKYIPAYLPAEIVYAIIRHGGLQHYPEPIPVQTFRDFKEIWIDDIYMKLEYRQFQITELN